MPNLGDVMPDFTAETNEGTMNFHEWLGGSWAILFSHPADFTPVCTTELSQAHMLAPEFAKRGVKMVALSCDSVESHCGWIKDIKAYAKTDDFAFPIIDDQKRVLAKSLGMIDPDELDNAGMPVTARAVGYFSFY
jgi:1-Cys peroxiredoxin 6